MRPSPNLQDESQANWAAATAPAPHALDLWLTRALKTRHAAAFEADLPDDLRTLIARFT